MDSSDILEWSLETQLQLSVMKGEEMCPALLSHTVTPTQDLAFSIAKNVTLRPSLHQVPSCGTGDQTLLE